MEYRKLGTSPLDVSAIALGTGAMGGETQAWGQVDDNESIATIQCAFDMGVNLIDTSPGYGAGHSEEIVGKAIADRRDSVLIATECAPVTSGRSPGPANCRLTRESVLRFCEASLRRLRTEYIDIYCYRLDPATPLEQTMSAFRQLLDQAKIRALGLANCGCEEVSAALELGPVHSLQCPVSLLQRRATEDLLPFCRQHGIAVLAHSTLAKGLLTGKFSANSRITGLRLTDPGFSTTRYNRNLERVAKLGSLAARFHRTVAQLAIRWVIQQPGVTSAIVGAKRPSQITENLGVVGWYLEPADLAAIETILAGS